MKGGISPSYKRKLLVVVEAMIEAQLEEAAKRGETMACHLREADNGRALEMTEDQQRWLAGGIATACLLPRHKLRPVGTFSTVALSAQAAAETVADTLLKHTHFAGFPKERRGELVDAIAHGATMVEMQE